MNNGLIPVDVLNLLRQGTVIPALPLALNRSGKLDVRRQKALMRYYLDAGAGGIAAGVHTTQFAIRNPEIGLFRPILEIAREEFNSYDSVTGRPVIRIAGITGRTSQAASEADLARQYGFHAGLLSLAALKNDTNAELILHCRKVAEIIPVIGFYLQPAVGGRRLDIDFWREFSRIENVIAVKIAPFNRYQTMDVVRGVALSERSDEITLLTGNDDNILTDLLSEYHITAGQRIVKKRISGGLLGHWAVWTRSAVRLLDDVKNGCFDHDTGQALILSNKITDCNSAFFDTANNFAGCITGIHEVLRRQGLLETIRTLDPEEGLSPGQKEEIDRVYRDYPELNDDAFVAENLDRWLS